ncbi:aminodeoxychorismate lyase [Marinobacter hydrocarbonoclasticus]|nr:aminodeoxychorismate lyase [Marinobacter nauticus]
MKLWVDGLPSDAVPGDDRGLNLGDGHFTTMLVRQGSVVLWSRHRARLSQANARLGFHDPDWDVVEAQIQSACNGVTLGCLRLTLTRGSAGRGYQGQWPATPRILLSLSPYPAHYLQWRQQGVEARLAHTALARGGALVGLKTLGRLEQVVIKQEAAARQVQELIVTDGAGQVIEASAGNLLLVDQDDTVITPALTECGIAGVMRAELMDRLAEMGRPVIERPVSVEELTTMREVLVTNALMGVVPVTRIDHSEVPARALADAILEKLDLWR